MKFSKTYKNKNICAQISIYLGASVSLVDTLELIGQRVVHKRMKKAIALARLLVSEGKPVSEAFLEVFNLLKADGTTFAIIRSAEKSGNLQQGFASVGRHIAEVSDRKRAIASSMSYPVIVSVFAVGLSFALVVSIFPKIIPLFNSLKVPIPTPTKIALQITDFISSYFLIIAIGSVALFALCRYLYSHDQKIKLLVHGLLLRTPFIGRMIFYKESMSVAHGLAVLVESGIPLPEALKIVTADINSLPIRDELLSIEHEVSQGTLLSESISKHQIFQGTDWVDICAIGERTGMLSTAFQDIRHMYAEEFNQMHVLISKSTEPLLMVFVAGIVLFIALSVMQPMYSILQYVSPV